MSSKGDGKREYTGVIELGRSRSWTVRKGIKLFTVLFSPVAVYTAIQCISLLPSVITHPHPHFFTLPAICRCIQKHIASIASSVLSS